MPYDRDIKVGGMIEVPAAALALGMFIRKLDFLSIGTNDLIQYTLAIDRTDDTVAHLYDPAAPGGAEPARQHHQDRGQGEGAGRAVRRDGGRRRADAAAARASGCASYSMHSAHLLDVKQVILKSNLAKLKPLARKMLRAERPREAPRHAREAAMRDNRLESATETSWTRFDKPLDRVNAGG